MFSDDISQIETGASCYTISNATTLYSYKNYNRYTYTQIGGKWYKTAQSAYNTIPSNIYCVDYSVIEGLSSKAEFIPIYATYALLISGFIMLGGIWLLFKGILRRAV